MTNYLPDQIIVWFQDEILAVHKSTSKVPRTSRGIRLVGPKEPIKSRYLYIGSGRDIAECIANIQSLEEPVCFVAAGPCEALEKGLLPDEVYLICINSSLASLYNRIRECIHHYRIIESPSDSIHISKTLQQICEDIIECRVTDDAIINTRLSEGKFHIGDCFRLFTIVFAESESPNGISWNFIITRLEEIFPTCYINMFGNNILIIEPNAEISIKFKPGDNLMSLLEQYDCFMGGDCVGFHFSSLSAMYSQALAGIRYGTKLNSAKRYYPYESYAMHQMIEFALDSCGRLMKTRNPIHLCNIEAVTLINYDTETGDNLMEVLTAYLRHNCNISETARALFIHRNTMNNKVHKIEEVMGRTLEDPDFLERLRFSCRVYDYQTNFLSED